MSVLEALNFVILKRFAEPLLPMGNSDYMQAIFEQSEEVLKQHSKSSLAAWPTKIHVEKKGMPLEAHELDEQESEPIYKALLEEKLLQIEYSRGIERCEANLVTTLQPLGLVFRNHTVYLVARYFNDLEKVRLFSMNRIKEAKCLDQGFKYPSKKVFKLKNYVEAGHTGFTYGEKVEEKSFVAAGVIGSVDENKNTHVSIERAVKDGHKTVMLYGQVTDQKYFEDKIKKWVDKGTAVICGYENDRNSLYGSLSDVYHSSSSETFNYIKPECKKAGVEYHGLESAESGAEYWDTSEILSAWEEILSLK